MGLALPSVVPKVTPTYNVNGGVLMLFELFFSVFCPKRSKF